jgi:DNA-binding transcriptional LysR family regulator
MDLNEIAVFARVVQAGSFTKAATALGIPKSTVSRKVTALEERLKARLLNRTTRRLSLTDVGRTYYDYSARIVSDMEDAERAVSSMQETPRGLLRVTTPLNIAFLGPIVSDFLKRYPEVRLELVATGRRVDLIEERFDLAIRAGTLNDSTLVARSLGQLTWFLIAAPAYLKKRGRPPSPESLKDHDTVLFGVDPSYAILRFKKGDEIAQVSLVPRMLVGDMDVVHAAVAAGLGIASLPSFFCLDDLRARRFERVLRDWNTPSTPMHVVYPSSRHVSSKVKSFVDHLHARMTPPPWELGPIP